MKIRLKESEERAKREGGRGEEREPEARGGRWRRLRAEMDGLVPCADRPVKNP